MSAASRPRRRTVAGLLAALAIGTAIVVSGVLATRSPPEGAPDSAIDDDRVVATLRTTGAAYSDALRARLHATRARPDDLPAAKAAARALIDEGRRAGDSRLVGAALGVLRPFLAAPDAETLTLAATARQYQHDFTGALSLLDRALALAPRDAGALLSRATITVVIGRLDAAQADCRRLHALPRPDLGFLCQSSALTLTASAPGVYDRLAQIVGSGLLDVSLRGYALGLMGEIAMLQGDDGAARTHLAAVLSEDPDDLRARMMLADLLVKEADAAGALALLEGAAQVDGVLLRRAIAAKRLGEDAIFIPAQAELARRFRTNLDLGLTAHAREETRYFLEVAPDPSLALGRAQVNWSLQREFEDAQLLIDAAVAAGEPGAAAPVLRWIAEQNVTAPALRVPDAVRAVAR